MRWQKRWLNLHLVESSQAGLTLPEDFFELLLEYADVRPSTIRSYSTALKAFALYLSAAAITAPTRKDILDYKTYLIANYKSFTVQSYLAAIRIFFKWTSSNSPYPNITDNVKGGKADRSL